MKIFGRNLDEEIAVVAEIGVNHEGDIEVAERLIALAADSGADAVKFQSYTPRRFLSSVDQERFARIGRFGLDEAAHRRLAAVAAEHGVAFFSSAITEDWVPLLAELGPAIKIASGDLTFEPVLRAAAQTDRPIILSTGCSEVDEIDDAVAWLRDEIGEDALGGRLVLLHCVSAYPTPVEEANVRSVPFLKERYGLTVGYSNHVIGAEAVLAAVALGAALIEVHFTDRKTDRAFRDHALSFEPADLAALVASIGAVRASLGAYAKAPQNCEAGNSAALRKGVIAARDLSAGTILEREDLIYARPATEFAAHELPGLLGQRLHQAVGAGEPIPRDGVSPS